jgi:hypothetical protein
MRVLYIDKASEYCRDRWEVSPKGKEKSGKEYYINLGQDSCLISPGPSFFSHQPACRLLYIVVAHAVGWLLDARQGSNNRYQKNGIVATVTTVHKRCGFRRFLQYVHESGDIEP